MDSSSTAESSGEQDDGLDRGGDPRDEVVDRIVAAACAEVAAEHHLPEEPLRRTCDPIARAAVNAVLDHRPSCEPPVEAFAALARQYAREGVPAEVVVGAFRVSVRRAWDLFASRSRGGDARTDVDLVAGLWAWADAAASRQLVAYRTVELGLAREEGQRSAFVTRLLHGGLSSAELEEGRALFALSPTVRYRALRARTRSRLAPAEVARSIEIAFESPEPWAGMVVAMGGDVAGIVAEPPAAARDVTIGLGPPAELQAMAPSFRLASRALETAIAFGVDGVVTMESLGVRPALLAESHIGDALVRRYIDRLDEVGEFGATLLTTVRVYMDEGMSIERSARILFIHPNTLRHRLERFTELTGADLTRPEDIVAVWWALERRRMAGPATER